MAKKVTLEVLATQMQQGFTTLEKKITTLETLTEKGFAAAAEDIGGIRGEISTIKQTMATKDQLIALHTQVNSIERQFRDTRVKIRLADLEDKVFGKVRA